MKEDMVLALHTFYEGRVQTTRSILVGILTGILSLQIPLLLDAMDKQRPYSFLSDPIVYLFILSLPMFGSLKLHMWENNDKSKYFRDRLQEPLLSTYNPELSNRIYKVRRDFPLELELFFLGTIFFLAVLSRIFHKF